MTSLNMFVFLATTQESADYDKNVTEMSNRIKFWMITTVVVVIININAQTGTCFFCGFIVKVY